MKAHMQSACTAAHLAQGRSALMEAHRTAAPLAFQPRLDWTCAVALLSQTRPALEVLRRVAAKVHEKRTASHPIRHPAKDQWRCELAATPLDGHAHVLAVQALR